MATTFKFGNGNWAVKEDYALAYNDENGNFKPLPFDFTRASTATRVNKDGLIETVPSGKPRIDFLNNTSGHLLLEPSRSNLITYSQEFDGYTKYSVTVEDDFSISPDGSQNAAKLTDTDSYDTIRTDATVVSGSTYTISIFAKNPSSGKFALRAYSASGNDTRRLFNLSNLTVSSAGGDNTGLVANSDNIQDYGNGWYRCSFSYVPTSTSLELNIYPGEPTNTDSNSVEVYGFQCEPGSYPTSYIPTEGSTVTRLVDLIQQSGFQGKVMNSTQGTIFIHFDNPMEDGDNNDFHMFRTTGTSYITDGFLFRFNTGTGVDILERVSDATGASFSNIVTKGQKNKIAISFTSSTFFRFRKWYYKVVFRYLFRN